jgi:FKBP-type peptidyl-prolyl cis-trans isomerase (trigger factor)
MIDVKIKKLPGSEVEIQGELPEEALKKHRAEAVKNISAATSIDGFRKGHIPESVLVKHVGETVLMTESAELALTELYPSILAENGVDAIGRPQVELTKLAPGNPVGFRVRVAVMPEVNLPDYRRIAKEVGAKFSEDTSDTAVTDEEVAAVVEEARRRHAAGKSEDGTPPAELPELTDDVVKEFGAFSSVADFKTKIQENLVREKEQRRKEKKRLTIIETVVGEAKTEIPRPLAEAELDRMVAQFKMDISEMGLKPEAYLGHVGKTEADLRKEWAEDASKRVGAQLAIDHIAAAENIAPSDEEIEHEIDHLKEHYPAVDAMRIRSYVLGALTHEKVFQFLETQG